MRKRNITFRGKMFKEREIKIWVLGIMLLSLLSVMSFASGGIKGEAICNESPIYYPQGSYTWIQDGSQGSHTNGSGSGEVLKYGQIAVARMEIQNVSSVGTMSINPGHVLSLTTYNITACQISGAMEITSSSFVLKRNGTTIISASNLGTGTKRLLSSALNDGEYEFTYECSYNPNQYSIVRFIYTFSFEVDNTAPPYSLTSSGANISSGTYTSGTVKYQATDSNFDRLYFKGPGANDFSSQVGATYTVGAGADGEWSFKAKDIVDNYTEIVKVYVDKTVPTAKILSESGTEITAGYYNKKIKFSSVDNLALNRCEYKENGGSWKTYVIGTYITAAGSYSFRGIDKAGNISVEKSISIDTVLPEIAFFANGTSVPSSGEVSAESIRVNALDLSGIDKIYVKRPGETVFSIYTANSELTGEGKYFFYARDNAGNTSETKSITLDKTPPELKLYEGSVLLTWSAATNAAGIRVLAEDNLSLEISIVCRKPGGSLLPYNGETLTFYGEYLFYATDKAGNKSVNYIIFRDDIAPEIKIINNLGEYVSEGYMAGYFTLEVEDAGSGLSSIKYKGPGMGAFTEYPVGTRLRGDGEFSFYATDKAGNISATRYLTLDNTEPIGQISLGTGEIVEDAYTNAEYISYQATDLLSGVKEIFVKKPARTVYEKYISGAELSVEGKYCFYASDNVGNISEVRFVTVDRQAPGANVVANGMVYPSGKVLFSDVTCQGTDNIGVGKVFVKKPGETEYTEYFGLVVCTKEGEHSFYVADLAGNTSEALSFVIDKTPPEGTVVGEDEQAITSGVTASAFKYLAEDAFNVDFAEYKTPGGMWQRYDGGYVESGQNGSYSFRSRDIAGNFSEELGIVFDNARPVVCVFDQAGVVVEKRYARAEYIAVSAEDEGSGIEERKVMYPGDDVYSLMNQEARFYGEGTYMFRVKDNAGNWSEEILITLDRTAPSGRLYVDGSVSNGRVCTNGVFSYDGIDAHSFVEYVYIKHPNSIEWATYNKEEDFYENKIDGEYSFKCRDAAGNESEIMHIVYDATRPVGKVYGALLSSENPVFPEGYAAQSGELYSRSESITYHTLDTDVLLVELLMPGSEVFTPFTLGSVIEGEGRYVFRCKDLAGNYSEESEIIVDRTPEIPILVGVNGGVTEGLVRLEAPLSTSFKVNGIEIISGEVIATIYGGTYEIETIDMAGNVYITSFLSTNNLGLGSVPIKEWYETEIGENVVSFALETDAVNTGMAEEYELVILALWANGEIWNTGITMDSVDSVNARPGNYYIYKSESDESKSAAYFSDARLMAVMESYARKKIHKFRYFEKEPAKSYPGQKIYLGIDEDTVTIKRLELAEGLRYEIDGEEVLGSEYSAPGVHTLRVEDGFGNVFVKKIRVITEAPKIYLRLGENIVSGDGLSGYIEADVSLMPYCFLGGITIAANEETAADAWFYVKDSGGNIIFEKEKDERIVLETSGKYYIGAVNRFSYSQEMEIYISNSKAEVTYIKDDTAKKLRVVVQKSLDSFAEISDIKIYKSVDGSSFVPLLYDDYGNHINRERTEYSFRASGSYKVVVDDRFRIGNKAVSLEMIYVKPFPVGVLSGVEVNGVTNGKVHFSWTDEARAYIERKGEARETYEKGEEIAAEGEYIISLSDYDNNIVSYPFIIKTSAPVISVTGVNNGGKTSSTVVLNALGENARCIAFRNGVEFSYVPGQSLTAPGVYEMRFVDLAGNESNYSFEITEKARSKIYIYFIAAFLLAALLAGVVISRKRSGFKTSKPRIRTR